jgi:hypothetical protein
VGRCSCRFESLRERVGFKLRLKMLITPRELEAWKRKLTHSELTARSEVCRREGRHSPAQLVSNPPQTYCSMCLQLLTKQGSLLH